MDLTKSEIEQLELLQSRYQNGQLSSAEYESAREAILRGRRSPTEHSALEFQLPPQRPTDSENDSEQEEANLPPSKVDVRLLTTCAKRSKKARQSHLQRQQESLNKSAHAKNKRPRQPTPTSSTLYNSSDISLTPRLSLDASNSENPIISSSGSYEVSSSSDSISATSSGSIPSVSESVLQQVPEDRNIFVPILASLCVVLLLTVVLLKWTPIESLIAKMEGKPQASSTKVATASSRKIAKAAIPKKVIPASQYYIKPLFGPAAVAQCAESCSKLDGEQKAICNRACGKLSVGEYARRIATSDAEPKEDAELIISRCASYEEHKFSRESRGDWIINSRSALSEISSAPRSSRLGTFRDVEGLYKKILKANNNLSLPTTETSSDMEITRALLEATCLRANLALTELGILTAQFNLDSFSRRYYYSVYKILRPVALQTEKDSIALTKEKNYFSQVTLETKEDETQG